MKLLLALALPSAVLAQPLNQPLRDDTSHAVVQEAGRLLRARLRGIRPDGPARAAAGLRPAAITSEVHGNVIIMRGADGEFDVDWEDPRQLSNALGDVLVNFYDANPGRNPHFLVLNTTFLVQNPAAFYQPLANNVRGIGYEYDHGSELFDTPGIALNGIIFMNSYRTYAQNGPIGRFTFNQEIGHRWGTFVRFRDPATGMPSDELLGRDCQHWSFFMDSDNSAMEGNAWEDLGNGRFRTVSSNMWGYNPLDHYLMGFAPKAAVGPVWFVRDTESWDCTEAFRGRQYNPRWESPTQLSFSQEQVEVEGQRVDVSMDDITAVLGERDPDYRTSRRTWSALFILVARQNDQVDDRAIAQVDALRLEWERTFEREATPPGFPGPDLVTTLDGSRVDPPPPDGVPLGERCVRTDDCAEGLDECIGLGSGVRVCTVECTADAPCGAGYCCTPSLPGAPDFPFYCVARSGEGACSPVPDDGVAPDAGAGGGGGEADLGVPDAAPVVDAASINVTSGGGGGGDGCQAQPGAPGAGLWALLGLGVLGRRRRRAPQAPRSRNSH